MFLEKGKYEQIGFPLYKQCPNWREQYGEVSSIATPSQIALLMGLISSYRFADGSPVRRVAEVGVYSGVTSLYMLKAGTSTRLDFMLYGIEKGDSPFFGGACRTVATEEERSHWKYFGGKTSFDIENILVPEEKLDMVFVDACHAHPYPVIDLLFLLPYLRQDALLIFHDVRAEIMGYGETGASCVYEGWPFSKYLNWNVDNEERMPSCEEWMGILRMPRTGEETILEESLLTIAGQEISMPVWAYTESGDGVLYESKIGGDIGLARNDIAIRLHDFMMRYYSPDFTESCCTALLLALETFSKNWIYRKNTTAFLHAVAANGWETRHRLEQSLAEYREELSRMKAEQENIQRYASIVENLFPKGSLRRRFGKWVFHLVR